MAALEVARQSEALLAEPGFQIGEKRRAFLLAQAEALAGGKAVRRALNVEQRIDAFNGLQRNRGDGRRLFARWGVGGDVGQFEELPPRMRQRVPSGVRHCCAGQVVSGLVQHLFQRISSSGGFRHEH
jgi:hypothetical protein